MELSSQIEKQSIPSEFPLTGSASIEEIIDGDPMCLFTAAEGVMVVDTAIGTVVAVTDDEQYGKCIEVDHGNGYVSVYRNAAATRVSEKDEIPRGTALFQMDETSGRLGYEILYEDQFIDPLSMLEIAG